MATGTGVERQPTRSKRIREDRRFDKTQLRINGHGRTVHRDYLAHALRWRFVTEELNRDPGLGYWAAGLIDGEGSFLLDVHRREGHAHIFFAFGLALREDDGPVLTKLQLILGGLGQFQPLEYGGERNPQIRYTITGKENLTKLVAFLSEFPLQSKKAVDFKLWSEALHFYMEQRQRHTPDELFDEMRSRSEALQNSRRYEKWFLEQERPLQELIESYPTHVGFKWGWMQRQLKAGLSILDVGCGQDQPMLYVLGARIQTVPDCYLGVDMNRINKKSRVRWAEIWDEFDFVSNWQKVLTKYTPFDVAVCFEVIEHANEEDGAKLLAGLYGCLRPGGVAYLSTPVFNGLAAANHIREYTIPELQAAIERAGFVIERRLGTFASKPEIKHACLTDGEKGAKRWETYQELEKWFGGEVMATFLAPLYPDHSRNNLWVLAKPTTQEQA